MGLKNLFQAVKIEIIAAFCAYCILSTTMVIPAEAAEEKPPENTSDALSLTDIESGGLESFVDGEFKTNMDKYHIPGAVISIVKEGKVILSKGYGYADKEKKITVDPDKTLFRIGSLTKLFTITNVMQLVEDGKIGLNEDVNTYLKDFQIKSSYKTPVTMAELLTHTAGIDDDSIGDLSKTNAGIIPISAFLKKRMLPVVREPGTYIQYSSYGIALAACVGEEVSGKSCYANINDRILKPLGMSDTTFDLNAPGLAQGYIYDGSTLKKQSIGGYFNLYPVGGISSTAKDMSSFMIAHLNNGHFGGKQILSQHTAELMHSRHAGFNKLLPGFCYGFWERYLYGQRTICHSGYSPDGFLTEMSLFPQSKLGIFISVNQGANNSFPQDFITDFVGHYQTAKYNKPVLQNSSLAVDKSIAGTYRWGDYTRSTVMKANIFGNSQDVRVTVNSDGSITLNETDPFIGTKSVSRAYQVSQMVFRKSNGDYVVFKVGANGRKYMAKTSDSWNGTYEKISWYDQNAFQMGLFTVAMFLFLIEFVMWIIFLIRRLLKKRKGKIAEPSQTILSKDITGVLALTNISFFAISMICWGDRLRYGVPLDIKLTLCLPIISSVLAIALSAAAIRSLVKKMGSLKFRINLTLTAVLGLVFIWFYNYWNFIGFRY